MHKVYAYIVPEACTSVAQTAATGQSLAAVFPAFRQKAVKTRGGRAVKCSSMRSGSSDQPCFPPPDRYAHVFHVSHMPRKTMEIALELEISVIGSLWNLKFGSIRDLGQWPYATGWTAWTAPPSMWWPPACTSEISGRGQCWAAQDRFRAQFEVSSISVQLRDPAARSTPRKLGSVRDPHLSSTHVIRASRLAPPRRLWALPAQRCVLFSLSTTALIFFFKH